MTEDFLRDYYNLKNLRICKYTKKRIINAVKKFKSDFEFKTKNYEITILQYNNKLLSNHQYTGKRKQTAIRQLIKELYYVQLDPLIKSLSDLAKSNLAKQELSKLPANRGSNLQEWLEFRNFLYFFSRKTYREKVKEKMQEYYGKLLEKEKELQEMEEKRQEMLSIIQDVFCCGNENDKIIENEKELKECLSEQEFNIIKNIVKEKVKFIKVISCNNKKVVVFDKLKITL